MNTEKKIIRGQKDIDLKLVSYLCLTFELTANKRLMLN